MKNGHIRCFVKILIKVEGTQVFQREEFLLDCFWIHILVQRHIQVGVRELETPKAALINAKEPEDEEASPVDKPIHEFELESKENNKTKSRDDTEQPACSPGPTGPAIKLN